MVQLTVGGAGMPPLGVLRTISPMSPLTSHPLPGGYGEREHHVTLGHHPVRGYGTRRRSSGA
jgi:hypothetical protein